MAAGGHGRRLKVREIKSRGFEKAPGGQPALHVIRRRGAGPIFTSGSNLRARTACGPSCGRDTCPGSARALLTESRLVQVLDRKLETDASSELAIGFFMASARFAPGRPPKRVVS